MQTLEPCLAATIPSNLRGLTPSKINNSSNSNNSLVVPRLDSQVRSGPREVRACHNDSWRACLNDVFSVWSWRGCIWTESTAAATAAAAAAASSEPHVRQSRRRPFEPSRHVRFWCVVCTAPQISSVFIFDQEEDSVVLQIPRSIQTPCLAARNPPLVSAHSVVVEHQHLEEEAGLGRPTPTTIPLLSRRGQGQVFLDSPMPVRVHLVAAPAADCSETNQPQQVHLGRTRVSDECSWSYCVSSYELNSVCHFSDYTSGRLRWCSACNDWHSQPALQCI